MPPYCTGEASSSRFDLLAGVIGVPLEMESHPGRRPEGGWFDVLALLVGTA